MIENTLRRRVVNRTMEEHVDWQNLPDVIFGDIMMMVGLESLDTLHTCRQVCGGWNEMISVKWTDKQYFPSNVEIYQAKILGRTV